MKSRRGTILRYTNDRYTVALVLAVFALQLTVWCSATPLYAALLAVPLAGLSIMSACIHHNHQHVNVFRPPWLNRVFEIFLAVQTGVTSYTWVLHHNLGHHLNYLQQDVAVPGVDQSRWLRRDGTKMRWLEYALFLFLMHPIDVYRVGKKHPRLYRSYLLMHIPLVALLGTLLWLNPINTLILFVASPALVLFHTCAATYEHHSGLHSPDHAKASRNRTSKIFNLLSQNLGFHTAHHMRPGLHWSELPSFHETIRAQIPESQISPNFW